MAYCKIAGTGSFLPRRQLTNADLEKLVDTTDEWIVKRVGIKRRHQVSGDENTSYMAHQAAAKAMEQAQINPNDIDLIIVATVTSEYCFPSVAVMLQDMLGVTNECMAFDVSAACAGFIYALNIAEKYMRLDSINTALIVGVEALSRITDWSDRSTCVLFGDGAGAVVLQSSESPGIIATKLHADGQYRKHLYARNHLYSDADNYYVQMQGREVFKVATTKLGEVVEQILEKANMKKEDIDWLIAHQANKRIIDAAARKLGMPPEKVILTIEDHGNTSSASVPLVLDKAVRDNTIKPGDILLLEAFGGGFTWGAAIIQY